MKEKLIQYYMDIAERTSQLSCAKRLQVGCIIVKNNNIISFSWNGTPRGFDNSCEIDNGTELITKPEVLHAESNAIIKVCKSTENIVGSDMFCTHAPCLECAKLILQAEINILYFKNSYRKTEGIELLNMGGIKTIKLSI